MVNNCANPACKRPLHYLREGKVFLFAQKESTSNGEKVPQRLEHFWLCGECAKFWTLAMGNDRSVQVIAAARHGRRTKFPAAPMPSRTVR